MSTQPTSFDQRFTKYGNFLFLAHFGPFGHLRGVKIFASGQKMKVYTFKNECMQFQPIKNVCRQPTFLEPNPPHYYATQYGIIKHLNLCNGCFYQNL